MGWQEILGLVLTLLVMGVGLAGSVIPALPSTPLVLLAAVAHKLFFGTEGAGALVLGIMVVLTLVSLVLDQLVTAYGARRFGASWRGVLGAVVGGIVGMFIGLVGVLVGPFIGAALFELAGERSVKESSRAGWGATVGLLLAAAAKFACCVAMIALFVVDVVFWE